MCSVRTLCDKARYRPLCAVQPSWVWALAISRICHRCGCCMVAKDLMISGVQKTQQDQTMGTSMTLSNSHKEDLRLRQTLRVN
eukprot:1768883-Amphidinium_carterae.1